MLLKKKRRPWCYLILKWDDCRLSRALWQHVILWLNVEKLTENPLKWQHSKYRSLWNTIIKWHGVIYVQTGISPISILLFFPLILGYMFKFSSLFALKHPEQTNRIFFLRLFWVRSAVLCIDINPNGICS